MCLIKLGDRQRARRDVDWVHYVSEPSAAVREDGGDYVIQQEFIFSFFFI